MNKRFSFWIFFFSFHDLLIFFASKNRLQYIRTTKVANERYAHMEEWGRKVVWKEKIYIYVLLPAWEEIAAAAHRHCCRALSVVSKQGITPSNWGDPQGTGTIGEAAADIEKERKRKKTWKKKKLKKKKYISSQASLILVVQHVHFSFVWCFVLFIVVANNHSVSAKITNKWKFVYYFAL